jgi:hypothetical protein
MHPHVEYEALRCIDRETLERLQLDSSYLRDLVNHHKRTLPLRYVHYMEVSSSGFLRYFKKAEVVDIY